MSRSATKRLKYKHKNNMEEIIENKTIVIKKFYKLDSKTLVELPDGMDNAQAVDYYKFHHPGWSPLENK